MLTLFVVVVSKLFIDCCLCCVRVWWSSRTPTSGTPPLQFRLSSSQKSLDGAFLMLLLHLLTVCAFWYRGLWCLSFCCVFRRNFVSLSRGAVYCMPFALLSVSDSACVICIVSYFVCTRVAMFVHCRLFTLPGSVGYVALILFAFVVAIFVGVDCFEVVCSVACVCFCWVAVTRSRWRSAVFVA